MAGSCWGSPTSTQVPPGASRRKATSAAGSRACAACIAQLVRLRSNAWLLLKHAWEGLLLGSLMPGHDNLLAASTATRMQMKAACSRAGGLSRAYVQAVVAQFRIC